MRVYPIKDLEIIKKMKDAMRKNGDMKILLLFTLGLNTAFRISDLLTFTYEELRGNRIIRKEKKTSKTKNIPVPPIVREVFSEIDDGTQTGYIFLSRSNRNKGGLWTQQHIARELKFYASLAGFERNVGTHTMRKTFGYWRYVWSGKDLGLVQSLLNHSTSAETILYIGLDEEMRDKAYTAAEQQL